MKATVRFIVEYEMEVEIKTTLEPGHYEFEGFIVENDEVFDELKRLQEIISEQIDILENEQCQYVEQSLNFTTLYIAENT